jgi:hypothetical protein
MQLRTVFWRSIKGNSRPNELWLKRTANLPAKTGFNL